MKADRSSSPSDRVPAEGFPVGSYLLEEMQERGWTSGDLAARMGGTYKERAINELEIDLIIHCSDDPTITFGPETAKRLGDAFGVSPEYWLNLQAAYKAWHAAKQVHAQPEGEQ